MPEELRLTATAASVTVEWKRGFNGGSQQTFHLECAGTTLQIPDDQPAGEDYYTVRLGEEDGIGESTTYTVLLYAENELGESNRLQEKVTTKGSPHLLFLSLSVTITVDSSSYFRLPYILEMACIRNRLGN